MHEGSGRWRVCFPLGKHTLLGLSARRPADLLMRHVSIRSHRSASPRSAGCLLILRRRAAGFRFPARVARSGSVAFQTTGTFPERSWFGVIEDRDHLPNATRIAFAAESCADVDRLAAVVRAAGANNIEGPEDMAYSRIYRAVYFDDPSGNRLEIYYCED